MLILQCNMFMYVLKPQSHTPLFATNANPLQLHHSPRVTILTFNLALLQYFCGNILWHGYTCCVVIDNST